MQVAGTEAAAYVAGHTLPAASLMMPPSLGCWASSVWPLSPPPFAADPLHTTTAQRPRRANDSASTGAFMTWQRCNDRTRTWAALASASPKLQDVLFDLRASGV